MTWFRSVFKALDKADVKQEAPAVAFTCGPGLPGSLLVGPPPSKDSGEPPIGIEFRSVQVSFVPEYFCKCPFLRSICARPHKSEEPQQGPEFLCTSLKSEASWQASIHLWGRQAIRCRTGWVKPCCASLRSGASGLRG